MKKNKSNQDIFLFIIPAIFFIIDRIFKAIAEKGYTASNFLFQFKFIANTGISWGLLKGNSSLLLWISIIILGAIIYFYDDLSKAKLGTNLVIIGAISNILDRIIFGYIVDYVDFGFFPVFNIADACITLGGIYIILWFLFFDKNK
jgi:signal peptidase II